MLGIWCSISSHHPSLPDHFPGNPLVPGVVLLEEVIATANQAGYAVTGIPAARLLNPLAPDEAFLIHLSCKGSKELAFRVEAEDTQSLARGRLATA
jgi:3-hydroxymyristoyl/3-hydroxydecanoyl-(acyl carrier protein) dehydratase